MCSIVMTPPRERSVGTPFFQTVFGAVARTFFASFLLGFILRFNVGLL